MCGKVLIALVVFFFFMTDGFRLVDHFDLVEDTRVGTSVLMVLHS